MRVRDARRGEGRAYLEEDGHDAGEEDDGEHRAVAECRAGLDVDGPVSAEGG